MTLKLDTIITATLVACALVTTGLVIRREFVAPAVVPSAVRQEAVLVESWRAHLPKGTRIGPADAPVQLIEFADFECPFCATYSKNVKALRERHPEKIALTYVHYPLPMHRFAEPAARVAECAGAQGRFEAMHDVLFARQREFGLRPWSEFAIDARISDSAAFEECVKSTEPVPRIVEGTAFGSKLDIKGTPTIVINGWKLARPPSIEELDVMVKAILAGKSPITTDGKAAQ